MLRAAGEGGTPAMEEVLHSHATGSHPSFRLRRGRLTRCSSFAVAALALTLSTRVVHAAENVSDGAHAPHAVFIFDSGLLYPGTLTIHHGDPLDFRNYSSEFVTLTFIEPKNAGSDLRCGATDNAGATAPDGRMAGWSVSTSGPNQELTVTIPPGRFSSACSLAAGRYVFLTER